MSVAKRARVGALLSASSASSSSPSAPLASSSSPSAPLASPSPSPITSPSAPLCEPEDASDPVPPLPPVGLLPVGLLRRLPTLVFGADGRSLPCVLEQHALSYLDVIWLAALRACSRGLRAFVNGYLTRAPELTLASPTHEPGPFRNAWRQAFDMVDDARALTSISFLQPFQLDPVAAAAVNLGGGAVGASVDRLCRVIRHNAATLRVVRYDPRLAELAVWAALLQCPQLEGPVDFVGEWHKMGSADHRCLYRLASQLADSCRRVTDLAVTMLHITVDTLRKLMCAGLPLRNLRIDDGFPLTSVPLLSHLAATLVRLKLEPEDTTHYGGRRALVEWLQQLAAPFALLLRLESLEIDFSFTDQDYRGDDADEASDQRFAKAIDAPAWVLPSLRTVKLGHGYVPWPWPELESPRLETVREIYAVGRGYLARLLARAPQLSSIVNVYVITKGADAAEAAAEAEAEAVASAATVTSVAAVPHRSGAAPTVESISESEDATPTETGESQNASEHAELVRAIRRGGGSRLTQVEIKGFAFDLALVRAVAGHWKAVTSLELQLPWATLASSSVFDLLCGLPLLVDCTILPSDETDADEKWTPPTFAFPDDDDVVAAAAAAAVVPGCCASASTTLSSSSSSPSSRRASEAPRIAIVALQSLSFVSACCADPRLVTRLSYPALTELKLRVPTPDTDVAQLLAHAPLLERLQLVPARGSDALRCSSRLAQQPYGQAQQPYGRAYSDRHSSSFPALAFLVTLEISGAIGDRMQLANLLDWCGPALSVLGARLPKDSSETRIALAHIRLASTQLLNLAHLDLSQGKRKRLGSADTVAALVRNYSHLERLALPKIDAASENAVRTAVAACGAAHAKSVRLTFG